MLPLYNQAEWVSIKATVEAEAATMASTYSCHWMRGSRAAMPASTHTGAGGFLSYMAYDPPTNKIKLLYAGSS